MTEDDHPKCGETSTTCPYCGVGCGVLVSPDASGEWAVVRGDPDHPANFGRLCSKGAALGETLSLDDRLLYPEVAGARASWDEALDLVAKRFSATIAEHGPDSVAFYVSGQLLTEDYYVANKLMKGFIGSANIDTNSRLCMASSVAGHKRAFGADTVPGAYEDLELADLVVLVGSNFAWCHPVLHQRMLAAREKRGTRVVVIDPRETATTADADVHLAIKPGSDVALFNGLFSHLAQSGARDRAFVAEHTTGLEDALAAVDPAGLGEVSRQTGIDRGALAAFYRLVEDTARTVTVYSQGVNQSSAGTDKVNAILNCHLVTGRVGKPGMGPFSITGQPNAMGGREVGGLANQLAAHMDFSQGDVDRVQRFWSGTSMATGPGLKAVDMFDAVADGRIKALWVMATNPAASLPNADGVRAAIASCPFVVVSDVMASTDTVVLADVKLPATAWGEKTGTVTNSERRISRQRSFLRPPGEARHDWDIVADVARRMGFSGFDYAAPAAVFAEHAALSAFENDGARDFDLGALAEIDAAAYDGLVPFQWPMRAGAGVDSVNAGRTAVVDSAASCDVDGDVIQGVEPGSSDAKRFFGDGRFFTPDGRGRFVPTPVRAPGEAVSSRFPLILNTGRVRDHWHTMTRTAKTARLSGHIGEPYLEIHPKDAARFGLKDADLAEVVSGYGLCVLRVLVTKRVGVGQVFAPMHWTGEHASLGRVDALTAPITDPVSGQPELKHTPVRVGRAAIGWQGFAVLMDAPDREVLAALGYWALARSAHGWRLEFGLDGDQDAVARFLVDLGGHGSDNVDVLALDDHARGQSRRAVFDVDGVLRAGVFVQRDVSPGADRAWLAGQVGQVHDSAVRLQMLAGRPPASAGCGGRTVCSCLGVGLGAIEAAIAGGAGDVAAIGAATQAGTNCGSCKPELAQLLKEFGDGPAGAAGVEPMEAAE